jgi:hypothetical protein
MTSIEACLSPLDEIHLAQLPTFPPRAGTIGVREPKSLSPLRDNTKAPVAAGKETKTTMKRIAIPLVLALAAMANHPQYASCVRRSCFPVCFCWWDVLIAWRRLEAEARHRARSRPGE